MGSHSSVIRAPAAQAGVPGFNTDTSECWGPICVRLSLNYHTLVEKKRLSNAIKNSYSICLFSELCIFNILVKTIRFYFLETFLAHNFDNNPIRLDSLPHLKTFRVDYLISSFVTPYIDRTIYTEEQNLMFIILLDWYPRSVAMLWWYELWYGGFHGFMIYIYHRPCIKSV